MGKDSAAPTIEYTENEERGRRNKSVGSFYHQAAFFRNFVHSAREKSWLSLDRSDIIVGPRKPWCALIVPLFSHLLTALFPPPPNAPSLPEAGRSRGVFGALDLVAP